VALRDKLRRLERAAGKHAAGLVCEECGETIVVPKDIALRLLYAAWHARRGEEHNDPAVMLIERHPHDALVDRRTGRPPGLPGMPRAR
jgi:hypothetical protein